MDHRAAGEVTACSAHHTDDSACTEQASEHVTTGCVHEHLSRQPYCERHTRLLREATMGCWPCWSRSQVDVPRVVLTERTTA